MKVLTSNFEPLTLPYETFVSRWEELFTSATSIRVGVGYASNDSMLYLKKLLELNERKSIDVCLGMAYFEGLSKSQFDAALELDGYLETSGVGNLKIARNFPFHGKIQSFKGKTIPNTCLVGSSNLSNIVPPKGITRRNYEVDLEISGQPASDLDLLLEGLFAKSSIQFSEASKDIKILENKNSLLSTRSDVSKIDLEKLESIEKYFKPSQFEIPLKDTPKSNLNVYFGEGRKGKQGFVKPRHWYEVEIIVDQEIQRASKNYPTNMEFIAYTDDGYKFPMKTSGDYGKNLRSRDDLTILGRWIKGRLEARGALRSGQLVTNSVFDSYGRNSITMTQTSLYEIDEIAGKLPVWYFDFAV